MNSSTEYVVHDGDGDTQMRHQTCLLSALDDGIQAFQNNILPTVMAASDMRANILKGTAVRTTSPAAAANITVPRCPAHTEGVSGIMRARHRLLLLVININTEEERRSSKPPEHETEEAITICLLDSAYDISEKRCKRWPVGHLL